jgi:hypothetical protein
MLAAISETFQGITLYFSPRTEKLRFLFAASEARVACAEECVIISKLCLVAGKEDGNPRLPAGRF